MAYGKAVAVGSGVGWRNAAAWSWAAAAALYTPLAARAAVRPRVSATPRNAAADTGDITTSKIMHIHRSLLQIQGEVKLCKSYVEIVTLKCIP